jgi:hypothetical protein
MNCEDRLSNRLSHGRFCAKQLEVFTRYTIFTALKMWIVVTCALKTEGMLSSGTLATTYKSAWCHKLEVHNRHLQG